MKDLNRLRIEIANDAKYLKAAIRDDAYAADMFDDLAVNINLLLQCDSKECGAFDSVMESVGPVSLFDPGGES